MIRSGQFNTFVNIDNIKSDTYTFFMEVADNQPLNKYSVPIFKIKMCKCGPAAAATVTKWFPNGAASSAKC